MLDDPILYTFQEVGRALITAGLAFLGAGNLSVWTPEAVLITRESALLDRLTAADLCAIGRTTLPPAADPSLDTPIHRAIYVMSGAKAVLHAQPPHAVALAFDRHEFVPEDVLGRRLLGCVPVVSPRRSIVEVVAGALERAPIALVAGHGAYARGADLWECLRLTAALEASARLTYLRAPPVGPPTPRARPEA